MLLKVLHLISGGDKGGAKTHVFTLLSALMEDIEINVICFMEGVFYQEIKDMPIPSMLIKQRYRNDLTILTKLVKHIRSERYDVIHAHGARANFITLLIRPFIKIPIITTVHSDYRMDFTQNIYKRIIFTELNAVSLRFLDYYIAVSDNFKDMLVERKFDSEKVYTVYNAIDFNMHTPYLSKSDFLKRHKIKILSDSATIVGIIGRFDKVKGHEIFIKAANEILKVNKDVLFLLAGEGPEQSNLKNLVKNFGIQENIIFTGFVDDIFSFINAIDINVLSSYSESFPYVMLEGALMKKATVSTAVGGIPDLIKDGETGFLAESANYCELADKILKFVENRDLREELGYNLYAYAKENFSKDSMKNRHIEIYNDVLSQHKKQNKLFDIMLSGYYGFNNSGDEALLSSIIQSLRSEKKDVSIIVLSKTPLETSRKHNVFSIKRYNFYHILKYIKRCKVFVNGGGSLIQDITSTHSLVYYTMLMFIAKNYRLKVMLYANGIGPISKKYNIKTAFKALKSCDYISLREPESIKELEKLGLDTSEAVLSSDPALLLTQADKALVDQIFHDEKIDVHKKFFAITVRQWTSNDANFCKAFAKAIKEISEKHNVVPLFIPMQFPDDHNIAKKIISYLDIPYAMLNKEYEVSGLIGVIGRTEMVIAMRLHTLIYAVSIGVPIVGIAYDPKIKSFMEYMNLKTYVNYNESEVDKIIEMTNNIFENLEVTKRFVSNEVDKLKDLSKNDSKVAISLISS